MIGLLNYVNICVIKIIIQNKVKKQELLSLNIVNDAPELCAISAHANIFTAKAAVGIHVGRDSKNMRPRLLSQGPPDLTGSCNLL